MFNTFRILFFFFLPLSSLFAIQNFDAPNEIDESTKPLQKLSFLEYPEFVDDLEYIDLQHSIQQSISYYKRLSPNRIFFYGGDSYTAEHMIISLNYFSQFIDEFPNKEELKDFIESFYLIYTTAVQKNNMLFTAYCEPLVRGSLTKTAKFSIPIFSAPSDLVYKRNSRGKLLIGRYNQNGDFVSYYSRKEINELKILENKAKPIVWVESKFDRLNVEIEGTGNILLQDGAILHLQYQTKNGHPYRSIGKYMIKHNLIPKAKMSMDAIRDYFKKYPKQEQDILTHNPSFVFFEKGSGKAKGSLAVELTPGRSLATDRELFPQGALAFIKTKKPVLGTNRVIKKWTDFSRFVLNQDTGGAIKGGSRGDIFFGAGNYAQVAASRLKHFGDIYFLILNPNIKVFDIASKYTIKN